MTNRIVRKSAINFVLILAASFPVWAGKQLEPRLITVLGDAEVKVVPDEVILALGVETSDKDLAQAKEQNDEQVQKILDLAKKYKIAPKHVQTSHMSIEPRYKDMHERKAFIGYLVQKTIVFTLKDISKLEDLLNSSLNAGANRVYRVQFCTTELKKYQNQARILAIRIAQEKANALAKELGQKVGKPHTIREEPFGWWGSGRVGGVPQNIIYNGRGAALESESSIAPGQISINARVEVSFELE